VSRRWERVMRPEPPVYPTHSNSKTLSPPLWYNTTLLLSSPFRIKIKGLSSPLYFGATRRSSPLLPSPPLSAERNKTIGEERICSGKKYPTALKGSGVDP